MNKFQNILDRAMHIEIKADPYTGDFHSANTRAVFSDEFHSKFISPIKEDQIKAKSLRAIGKGLGLSLLYQASRRSAGYTLFYNSNVGDSPEEAQKFADKWYNGVPNFTKSLKDRIADGHAKGYTTNAFGRIRYIPKINIEGYENRKTKEYNERIATNFAVQGLGSEQIKLGLKEVNNFAENNQLNLHQGNLSNIKDFYTRILSIDVANPHLDEFMSIVDTFEDGNCKLLVSDGNELQQEYSRSLRITANIINEFGLKILW